MRHLRATADRTLRKGAQLWHRARQYGRAIDSGVQYAARVYGTIQPALRAANIDTSGADKGLMAAYQGYSALKNNIDSGIRVTDAVVSQLRGGAFGTYPG